MVDNNGAVSLLDVYRRVLDEIAALDRSDAVGARVRSKIQWAEEGEMSSRFFLRMERKRAAESWIPAMRLPDGSFVSDVDGICQSWVNYYSSLFSAGHTDSGTQSSLLAGLSSKLPDEARLSCEGLLSV